MGALYGLAIAARRQATNEAQQATNLAQQATSQKQYELAQKQYELAQKENFSDTFAKAVEAIASDSVTIKTSGIRIFEGLAQSVTTDSDDYDMIVHTINDFIRENAAPPIDENGRPMQIDAAADWPAPTSREHRQHIEVALRVLGDLVMKMGSPKNRIQLRALDLRRLNLIKINLERANMQNCHLSNAILHEADLTQAFLFEAKLTNAYLADANLTDAYLWKANLTNASLWKANFINAYLTDANLTGARLWEFPLGKEKTAARAYYEETSLDDFDTQVALKKLNAANFSQANLSGAALGDTQAIEGMFTEEQLAQMKNRPTILSHEAVRALLIGQGSAEKKDP